jgi:hypothetical protein
MAITKMGYIIILAFRVRMICSLQIFKLYNSCNSLKLYNKLFISGNKCCRIVDTIYRGEGVYINIKKLVL